MQSGRALQFGVGELRASWIMTVDVLSILGGCGDGDTLSLLYIQFCGAGSFMFSFVRRIRKDSTRRGGRSRGRRRG